MENAIELPEALRQLPPLPQVLVRALALARDGGTGRADLARVIALDQGLTGYFLRLVNSAYYGLARRITSLDEAIGYLGHEAVAQAIFAFAAGPALSRPLPAYMLERYGLWQHSVAVAQGSDWVAAGRGLGPSSEAYVAGLLHDVGKLALDLMVNRQPQWGGAAEGEAEAWPEVERQVAGREHSEVGAVLVRSWNLPDRVIEAVAYHHAPDKATLDPRFAAAVHVADAAALMAGIGVGVDGLRYPLSAEATRLLDWTGEEMAELVGQMQGAVARAEAMVGVRPEAA